MTELLLPQRSLAAIDGDQNQQGRAQHHAADRIRHLHGREQAGDQGQHNRTRHRAPVTAFSAGKQCASNCHCRNGWKEERLAQLKMHYTRVADQQKTTKAGQRASQRVGQQIRSSHIHA